MGSTAFTLLLLFAYQAESLGQVPKASSDRKSAEVLDAWIKSLRQLKSFEVNFTKKHKDIVFQDETKTTGTWKILLAQKPEELDRCLLIEESTKNDPKRQIVCSSSGLFHYSSDEKLVRFMPVANFPGFLRDYLREFLPQKDNLAGILLWKDTKELLDRYSFRLKGEDEHYFFVEVLPKKGHRTGEFKEAGLTFHKKTFHPRRLWIVEHNGNTMQWDFEKIRAEDQPDARGFSDPVLPPGWRLQKLGDDK